MAEPKTQKTNASVEAFLESIPNEQTRADCFEIVKMMKQAAKAEPAMWGSSIVGFGEYMLTYANGSQLPWPVIAFSPRKQYITLYIDPNLENYENLLKNLGKHSTAKVCLYIKKLADVDKKVLKEIIVNSVKATNKMNA
ncbi:MAG: DUF1801 domain-containing protein [Chloroflexi bacterium]|nr:MAG: DUF1801 domain-containing protein [Chloroflexota bacterium]MCQ3938978.1 DUF1801 domain-containing protein [Chloroflexota bacterium]MDL1940767.1 DUF1801 domain-containing protein [Chloroflexi bacterium CFX2]